VCGKHFHYGRVHNPVKQQWTCGEGGGSVYCFTRVLGTLPVIVVAVVKGEDCLCGAVAAANTDNTPVNMEQRWNDTDRGKTEGLGEKPVPVPLCPPQIPHGLTWLRNRASSVRSRRLTAWAISRTVLPVTVSSVFWIMFLISNQRPPSSTSIYCNCQDLECHHI
jgi:hypothetical protein